MADELLFDSDRLALKEKRKRRLILIAAIVGVLLITVIIALIIRGAGGKIHKGAVDSPYPYTWQMKKDGSLYLRIDHKSAPKLRWSALESEAPLTFSITRDKKDRGNQTGFVIKPEREGRSVVTLVLQDGDDASTRLYEYHFGFLVTKDKDKDGKLQLEITNDDGSDNEEPAPTEITGATDTDNPYRIRSADNGDLLVSVKGTGLETDWDCEILSGEECVEFLGAVYTEGEIEARFHALEAGQSKVLLYSEYAAAKIQLTLNTEQDGSLKLVSHEASFGEKPPAPEKTENPGQKSDGAASVSVPDETTAETQP